jgi:hypothetical protein
MTYQFVGSGDASWGQHYYSDEYWTGHSQGCDHNWELKHMFTSSYEKCTKCGAERDV